MVSVEIDSVEVTYRKQEVMNNLRGQFSLKSKLHIFRFTYLSILMALVRVVCHLLNIMELDLLKR